MPDLPIACTLTADELRSRGAELLPGLVARALEQTAIADGCRWRFAPADGLLAEVARVIDAERRCCRFLRFEVAVEPDAGSVFVSVSGPPGTAEFLSGLSTHRAG